MAKKTEYVIILLYLIKLCDMDKEKSKYKNPRRTSIYTLIVQSGKIEEKFQTFFQS
jgi:hypothetical protein